MFGSRCFAMSAEGIRVPSIHFRYYRVLLCAIVRWRTWMQTLGEENKGNEGSVIVLG